DIPEYANWMKQMVSKGHTVLLVGKDLEEIELSYKYPLWYWREHPRSQVRSLWLVALTTKMRKDSLRKTDSLSAMDESGDIFEIPVFEEGYLRSNHIGGGCSNPLCYPFSLSMSYNMPLPLPWPDCAYDMMQKRSWHTISRDSDSNIELVYLPNYCSKDILFDEATEASIPYFTAIFGSSAPFNQPIAIPYINLTDGKVRVTLTDPYLAQGIELPIDIEWTGEEWSEESDMDSFVFAFYQSRAVVRDLEYRRYQLMAIQLDGLDPDVNSTETHTSEHHVTQ
ncbi:hypothetical protein IL306_003947, partial [Fusarium sp. DS 682]